MTAIHTSGGLNVLNGNLGMTSPVGHIDWFPNGGTSQPGCGALIVDNVICHHLRAVDLLIESLEHKCQMDSYPCESWTAYKLGRCRNAKSDSEFGYPANRGAHGNHYFETTAFYPYCKR